MSNLFPIQIDVEEVAVGRVLRRLDTMEGIARIHLRIREARQLQEPVEITNGVAVITAPSKHIDGRSLKKGLHPSKHVAYRAIADVLQRTPAHLKILGAAIERVGLSSKSADGYLFRMLKMKFVRRTAPGTYILSEHGKKVLLVGDKPNPKRKLPPVMLKIANNHSGFRKFLLTALKGELDTDPDNVGVLSSAELKPLMAKAGFSNANLYSTAIKMRNEGLIEINNGQFSITEKGVEAIAGPPEQTISNQSKEGLEING